MFHVTARHRPPGTARGRGLAMARRVTLIVAMAMVGALVAAARAYDPARDCVATDRGDCVIAAIERARAESSTRAARATPAPNRSRTSSISSATCTSRSTTSGTRIAAATTSRRRFEGFEPAPGRGHPNLHSAWDSAILARQAQDEARTPPASSTASRSSTLHPCQTRNQHTEVTGGNGGIGGLGEERITLHSSQEGSLKQRETGSRKESPFPRFPRDLRVCRGFFLDCT